MAISPGLSLSCVFWRVYLSICTETRSHGLSECLLAPWSRRFGRYCDYLAIPTVSYVTVYLGLTNFRRVALIKGADYSYGIYLYGFVIQQLFASLLAPRVWWINALACDFLSALFAAFSWHFVEKPAQKLRIPLAITEQHYLTFIARLSSLLPLAAIRRRT
jgi:peptidoglycan/LPS O-acetylase OafA/YrhL